MAQLNNDTNYCDILLDGGTVITVDDNDLIIEHGSVAISDNKILAVGKTTDFSSYEAKQHINCKGKLILPGFIDCHNHLFQVLVRGIGDGMPLWTWLSEFMFPYSNEITTEEALVGVKISAIESIRNGTTSILDNHYAPADLDTTLAVANAMDEIGLRGVVARGMFGPMTNVSKENEFKYERIFQYSVDEELEITRAAMETHSKDSKVSIWPCPENITYCEQDLIRRSVELAREFGTGWHAHCSEVQLENDVYMESYGIRPVEWLFKEGLLGNDATLAHGIWFNDKEIEYLGETQTGIAHNPVCNQYLGSGAIRLRDLRSAGATVGLGTDGGAVAKQDMIEAIRQCTYLQRVQHLDPSFITAYESLTLATREAAKYLRIDAGQLAPGKLADVIVVAMDQAHAVPVNNVIGNMAYNTNGSDVEMTIINGEIVFDGNTCTNIDEKETIKEAQIRADELIQRASLSSLRVPSI